MKTFWITLWLVTGFLWPAVAVAADENAGAREVSLADEKTATDEKATADNQDKKGPDKALSENEKAADLAKKLANPIANLISLPLQYNYDKDYGKNDDGSISRLNIQPVIPISISKDWNVITRTIVPLIDQEDLPVKGKDYSGLGDILASQFFSPKEPTSGGWVWGAGPAWLLPTASNDRLGGEKWGVGPTAVVLKQEGPWTYGALANHIWSFTGDDDRKNVNATFMQPFLAYVTKTKTTISLNTESTFDWKDDDWSIPINLTVSQMFKIGKQIMQFQVGGRYWAETPDSGPEGWGLRLQLTFLFPK
jgi:hypothetical protein